MLESVYKVAWLLDDAGVSSYYHWVLWIIDVAELREYWIHFILLLCCMVARHCSVVGALDSFTNHCWLVGMLCIAGLWEQVLDPVDFITRLLGCWSHPYPGAGEGE